MAREVFDTLVEAKVLIARWRKAYNTVRSHSSLGYRPPGPGVAPLCRDCLFHLPESDVLAVLRNFIGHDIPYLLTSCHTACRINSDIPTGGFRLLNLQLAP